MRKNIWVCYCLLRARNREEHLRKALDEIQGLMERRQHEHLYQGFAVAKRFAAGFPFAEYEEGFRGELSGETNVSFSLENLVLAYGMFQQEADRIAEDEKAEAWLILLASGMDDRMEEVGSILRRFRRLPAGGRVRICWIAEEEQGEEQEKPIRLEPGLVDVTGLQALRCELMEGGQGE